jgi:hypothetical protein
MHRFLWFSQGRCDVITARFGLMSVPFGLRLEDMPELRVKAVTDRRLESHLKDRLA